ncbi:hypothetical protein ND748_20890 [Frankia sp. AiPs1]|uniref:hypothetical protein n=1 Tax=Frankia sp. AiPs1 TaxID=573493 RepID=UPI0020431249|nr:hypothetical protein [Frankia sp. AiPs1]MCM3924116.1 hypothetical protein [Frankia sp. AiPs1]
MSGPGTLTDFASALAAVTGVTVDLRGAASPTGGWITFGSPGWWTYAPFGSPLFTVGINVQALANWASAMSTLDGIADELAAGTLGLMDVRRLWDAEQTVRLHTDHLGAAGSDTTNAAQLFGGGDAPPAGTATGEIFGIVNGLAQDVSAYHDTLAGPPAIADTLHAAGEALAAFGRGMSDAYRQSALHNAAADGVNGIAANMQNYLFGQPVTTETVAQVLAGYSSSAVGGLPSGMADFGGDLAQPPVWSAASTAVTTWIDGELDTLDARARELSSTLQDAYQTATERLNSVAGTSGKKHFRRSEKPQDGEPTEGRVNELTPGLRSRSVEASNEVAPGRAGEPLTQRGREPAGALSGMVKRGQDATLQVSQGQSLPRPGDSQGQNTEASGTPTPEGTTTPISGEVRERSDVSDPLTAQTQEQSEQIERGVEPLTPQDQTEQSEQIERKAEPLTPQGREADLSDPLAAKTQLPNERVEGIEPLTQQGREPVGALSGVVSGGPDATLQVSQGQSLPGPGDSQGQNTEASGTPTPVGKTTSPV